MINSKHILTIALFIFLVGCKNDDTPGYSLSFVGDISLQTQSEIEDFGKNNYNTIQGSISIGGSQHEPLDIVSLAPLLGIDSISGNLSIIGTTTLPNLSGLQELKHVGGRVSIAYNQDLASVLGIENLVSVGGGFSIADNASLQSINLQMALETVEEDFSLARLAIPNIAAFSRLTSVGSLSLIRLNITNLDGLNALVSSGFSLQLIENYRLENIRGLSNLNSVIDVSIWDNERLTSLSGLEGITSSISLSILRNTGLTDLTGLDNMTTFRGNLIVAGNRNLESLNGLQTNINFTQERSALSFWSLPKLQSMEAYTFSGQLSDVVFADLPLIEKLPILTEQDSIYSLVIAVNDKLTNIDELSEIAFSGTIQIYENPVLQNIDGLTSLKSTYSVVIRQNPALISVDGLSSLDEVIRSMTIENNQALNDFCGLTNAANNGGLNGKYTISQNAYNPSLQDIIDGNCDN